MTSEAVFHAVLGEAEEASTLIQTLAGEQVRILRLLEVNQRSMAAIEDAAVLNAADGKNAEVRAALTRQLVAEHPDTPHLQEVLAEQDSALRKNRATTEYAERAFRLAMAELAWLTARATATR